MDFVSSVPSSCRAGKISGPCQEEMSLIVKTVPAIQCGVRKRAWDCERGPRDLSGSRESGRPSSSSRSDMLLSSASVSGPWPATRLQPQERWQEKAWGTGEHKISKPPP